MHQALQKTEKASASQNKLGAREKSHKQSLIKIMGENEELRQNISTLEEEMQLIYKAFLDEQQKSKDQTILLTNTTQDAADSEREVAELKKALGDKDKELQEAQDELSAVAELESELEYKMKNKMEEWRVKFLAKDKVIAAEKKQSLQLKTMLENLKNNTGMKEVEDKLLVAEREIASLKALVREKDLDLEKGHEELEQVASELVAIKNDQGKFIDVALENESKVITSLREELRKRDKLLEEERQRYSELYEDKGKVDEELLERDFWMNKYEQDHGLTEAVVYQKKLKNDVKRREKEIRRLNKDLNDRMSSHEKLYETCRLLKVKAGLSPDFEFPELELEEVRTQRMIGCTIDC